MKVTLSIAVMCTLFVQQQTIGQEETVKCGLLLESEEEKSEVWCQRPNLPDRIETDHFIIHYTYNSPQSQTYAELAGEFAEYSYLVQVGQMLWREPPSDDNRGGDDRYDIYLSTAFALGWGVTRRDFPNCNHENWQEEWVPSFIIIREDLDTDILKIVVAHEFNHAVQFAYTWRDGQPFSTYWFYENTATYMEDAVYDDVNEYLNSFLGSGKNPLNFPHLPINYWPDRTEPGNYPYAGMLWPTFLAEWKEHDAVRRCWERMGDNPGHHTLDDIDWVLTTYYASSLAEALSLYSVWRYFTGERADSYHFSEADLLPISASVFRIHDSYPALGTINELVAPGGTRFVEFTGQPDILRVQFDGANGFSWKAHLVETRQPATSPSLEIILDQNGDGQADAILSGSHAVVLAPAITNFSGTADCNYTTTGLPVRIVRFANEADGNNLGGELLLDGSDVVQSGSTRILQNNSPHNVKTLRERFGPEGQNPENVIRKHHDWNVDPLKFFLQQNFTVPAAGDPHQRAIYLPLNPVSLRNELVELPGITTNTGTLWFRDPWYLTAQGTQPNQFRQFDSPHSPTGAENATIGGVFFNQFPNPQNPNIPYYSARAQLSQPILGYPANFVDFHGTGASISTDPSPPPPSGYTQKAVVFTNANALVKARYKGHMISSSANVTAPNNQRKVVRDVNGIYHMVYESAGHIWYSKSTDQTGDTWTAEQKLSEDGPSVSSLVYKNPSVAIGPGTNQKVVVVWEASYYTGVWRVQVLSAVIDVATGAIVFDPNVYLNETSTQPQFTLAPVVSVRGNYALCLLYSPIDGVMRARTCNVSNGVWQQNSPVRETPVSSIAVAPVSFETEEWYVVWIEGDNLYYGEIPNESNLQLQNVTIIAHADYDTWHREPSIVNILYGRTPGVTWREWNWEVVNSVIKYRQRIPGGQWSSTVYVWSNPSGPSNYTTPTLTGHYNTENVAIGWQSSSTQMKYVKRVNGAWSSQSNLGTGVNPMANVSWNFPSSELVLSRNTTSPYSIQRHMITLSSGGQEQPLSGKETGLTSSLTEGRGGRIIFPNGTISLSVMSASMDSVPLRFRDFSDTTRITTLQEFLGALTTDEFPGRGTLRAKVLYTATGELPPNARFRVTVRDNRGRVLHVPISLTGVRDTIIDVAVSLNIANRMLHTRIEPENLPGELQFEG